MSITTFPQLLIALTRLIDGEEVSASEVSTGTLSQIISLGERRVYREVQHRLNEKAFSGTVTGNLFPVPADFQSTSVITFGKQPLRPVSEEWLLSYLDASPTGDCRYFCEAGSNFQFAPAVTTGTAPTGRYFYRWPDLSVTTLPSNTFFLAENDLFLYAMLAESAPFFGQDGRLPMWEMKFTSIRDRLNSDRERGAYSAGRMKRRPSTPVMR